MSEIRPTWSIPQALRGQIVEVGYWRDPTTELLYRRTLDRSDGFTIIEWATIPESCPDEEEICPAAWSREPDWLADCRWQCDEQEVYADLDSLRRERGSEYE